MLARSIDAQLTNAAVLEYGPVERADDEEDETGSETLSRADAAEFDPVAVPIVSSGGDRILQHVDVSDGEGLSIDLVTLLLEASRTDVQSILEAHENSETADAARATGGGLFVGLGAIAVLEVLVIHVYSIKLRTPGFIVFG